MQVSVVRRFLLLTLLLALVGCANKGFTVDDGRRVDEILLADITTYGEGESMLRPAIVRAAALKDAECDTQWELPFAVATSADWSADDRVAWVRALGVDERLTVVGVGPGSPLKLRDKIVQLPGFERSTDPTALLEELANRRDAGQPFDVVQAGGKTVRVTPFKLCRGYARLAPPNTPRGQDYHWLMSMHPLEVPRAHLTEDEALWLVLWSQGISEEGGTRMKTYHYTTKVAGTLYSLFSIATGLKGATMAAEAAIKVAQTAAANVASEVLKRQLMEQAASFAAARVRDELINTAQKLTQAQVVTAMQQAAANRGSLWGVARVAATVFDRADTWAYTRMQKLGANPLVGFALHQRLIEQGSVANAIVLDQERMASLSKLAEADGLGERVVAILRGIRPEELQIALTEMPLASAPAAFSYEDVNDPASSNQPYARGLIDAMLEMPAESGPAR